jgi:aminopeptidase N
LAKAPLFFIALEDAYGEEPVRQALTQIRSLLRGQEVGYRDIRAALENVTNKDLAPMFRTWVYNPGIPAEFQEKYQNAEAGKN